LVVQRNRGRRVHFDDVALNLIFDRALIVIKNGPESRDRHLCRDHQSARLSIQELGPRRLDHGDCVGRKRASRGGGIVLAVDGLESGQRRHVEDHLQHLGMATMWASLSAEYDFCRCFHLRSLSPLLAHRRCDVFWATSGPNVKRAADWIVNNIQSNGFGQADFSIWEEGDNLEYNVLHPELVRSAGLYATQALARKARLTLRSPNGTPAAAASIMTSFAASCGLVSARLVEFGGLL